MAFVVETGAGLANANSFATVQEWIDYWTDRGNTALAELDEEVIQALLIKGTDYLTQKYRRRWKGMRVRIEQALDWPRAGVQTEDYFEPDTEPRPYLFNSLAYLFPENKVPDEVKKACIELGSRANAGDLAPDLARGGQVIAESVGDISVTYADGAPANTTYQVVTGWIKPYLRGTPMRRTLTRS